MVSRLDPQKGIDIAIEGLRMLMGTEWQFMLLGRGDARLEASAGRFADDNLGRVRFLPKFDPVLARRVYGGADMVLLPSRYEPCGLTQMIAMRYGAVPVAHAVGGLRDTIIDASDAQRGTGFLFAEPSAAAFAGALERAMATYYDPQAWSALQRRGMSRDFSWKVSAIQYLELYRRAVGEESA
jgi:starch synthase